MRLGGEVRLGGVMRLGGEVRLGGVVFLGDEVFLRDNREKNGFCRSLTASVAPRSDMARSPGKRGVTDG
ncbi:hypothetical protein SUDANB145_04008 [Streptomyces sp. enrichment culture]